MNLFGDKETKIFNDAVFSDCGKYRYTLTRIWNDELPIAMCIGLNPSTANYEKNDNTIFILIDVLRKLGYGGFIMTNLYAIISSKPEILLTHPDPIGNNDNILLAISKKVDDVIFCWGDFKQCKTRAHIVSLYFEKAKCFGLNKSGTPMHPRALSYNKMIHNPTLILYNNEVF